MCPEISKGPQNTQGLLHAEETVERPFAMKLYDGEAFLDSARGNDMLTGVIALTGASPEEEAMEER